jgi:predicted RNA polymerase sigma factor
LADGHLGDQHLSWATRADVLRRPDRPAEADIDYERALTLRPTRPSRFLARRLGEIRPNPAS